MPTRNVMFGPQAIFVICNVFFQFHIVIVTDIIFIIVQNERNNTVYKNKTTGSWDSLTTAAMAMKIIIRFILELLE